MIARTDARDAFRQARWQLSRVAHIRPAELVRERTDRASEHALLTQVRAGRDVCWLESDDEDEPLVTVRIATFNRGQLVAERAIASALRQTYEKLEVLVIGDSCDAATEAAVRGVSDPRVVFVNLPQRGIYPADPMKRWMVAGTTPMNAGLLLARGAWIAPCDDDDELTSDHVEVLLRAAKSRRLEMVYSRTEMEGAPGRWSTIGKEPLSHGHISHGSVMYSLGLRFLRHSETSWRLHEPADWNLWRRMKKIGVKIGFDSHVTYRHYVETHRRVPT